MDKPIVTEQYADNGEFSHWHLIDPQTGCVMWSSFPEETEAQGQKIISFNAVLAERAAIAQKLKEKPKSNDSDTTCMTFFT